MKLHNEHIPRKKGGGIAFTTAAGVCHVLISVGVNQDFVNLS